MNDPEFDNLLRSAKGGFPLAKDFNHGVWSRIESEGQVGNVWWRMLAWTNRPVGVVCGLVTMVSIGLSLGAITVPESPEVRLSYMESISPFLHLANR